MDNAVAEILDFLETVHPYDTLSQDELKHLCGKFERAHYDEGDVIYTHGQDLPGLYLVQKGAVDVRDSHGDQISLLGPRNSFGERGLTRDGKAATTATSAGATQLLMLPADIFRELYETHAGFRRFFNRSSRTDKHAPNLATMQVSELLSGPPVSCGPDVSITEAARQMRDRGISCLAVTEGQSLVGILTTRDLTNRVLAEGLSGQETVGAIMTREPITLPPSALGTDVLNIMNEQHIGHLPITEGGTLIGIVTQTDLTRLQAVTSAQFVSDIARATDASALAGVTNQIPQLLVSLVGAGNRHEVVTRLITDIADAATRRLLAFAEAELGPPPVPYLWLACGSQGRREQTGVSDQDNCLILDDSLSDADIPYFDALARIVCDGLNACGYVYCPGDMMATNPRWRQPVQVWREYFRTWVETPNPEAQMLASVMFDLRPISGEKELFTTLQAETLKMASANSIFVAHMVSNSLKHTPPLGMIRGFATIRSGEFKNHIDMKHNGVVPVVDLARLYALKGQLTDVNTRARLTAAQRAHVLSESGANDLLDAYDLIAQARLEHQARLVKSGAAPENFLAPSSLSDFERSHLRDAFVVVKTMQSAIGHGRGILR